MYSSKPKIFMINLGPGVGIMYWHWSAGCRVVITALMAAVLVSHGAKLVKLTR